MSQKSQKQKPFWQRKQESFANVDVGTMIQCIDCNQKRFRARFSNIQIQKYQTAISRESHGGPKADLPRCIECTAGNSVELKCTGCGVTKGIDFFSKLQRRKPDEAKCRHCQQEIDDRLPGLEDALEEEQIREEHRPENQAQFPAMSSVASALPSAVGSISEAESKSDMQSTVSNGVMIMPERESAWGGRAHTVRSMSTDTSPSEYRAQSLSEYSTPATGSVYSNKTAKGGFHKMGAYKVGTEARVMNQMQREKALFQESQTGSKRDSSDDEDWEL